MSKSIKLLFILFCFIGVLACIYYLRIKIGEHFFILFSDFIIAGILNCFILGYSCIFIQNIEKKQNLPSLKIGLIPYVLTNKFLCAVYLFTMMPFVVVDDVLKNQFLMYILFGINIFTFVPMSIMLIGFSLRKKILYYLKYFKLNDYINNFLRFSSCFLVLLVSTYYILSLDMNLIIKTTIMCINVYIIHILYFVWFNYLTKLLLKLEREYEITR